MLYVASSHCIFTRQFDFPTKLKGLVMASVRYIVSDVQKAVDFYGQLLGFTVQEQFQSMAILKRGDLTLWLAGPNASASRPMPDGRKPEPGGWNRFVLETPDLVALVGELKAAGVRLRNDIVSGPGGKQILAEDPFGNVVELFQPAAVMPSSRASRVGGS
jgi:catechol 2,3-dioxygenase-like lactoylglutathione lyase family enzyme